MAAEGPRARVVEPWQLAPWAACEARSRGRCHAEPPHPIRSAYQRDRDRIIHASSFRRLEYKTQVFVNHEGDMFRTRLTHTLEVAQIGRTIARALNLNEDLTEAIALAHDLGHTPFGHAGQDALDEKMRAWGGFEHNLQSLRVVDLLEFRYPEFPGLNLTFETREGMLKYCRPERAGELGEIAARFLHGGQPSLEAQIANLADEIAYNHHDIDDGLRSGILGIEQLCGIEAYARHFDAVRARWPELDAKRRQATALRLMLNVFVLDLIETTARRLRDLAPADIDAVRSQPAPLALFSDEVQRAHLELKQFLYTALYRHPRVVAMSARARLVVGRLFDAMLADAGGDGPGPAGEPPARARAIADHIAGMTDRYALAAYERRFGAADLR
jgi:dGTPase